MTRPAVKAGYAGNAATVVLIRRVVEPDRAERPRTDTRAGTDHQSKMVRKRRRGPRHAVALPKRRYVLFVRVLVELRLALCGLLVVKRRRLAGGTRPPFEVGRLRSVLVGSGRMLLRLCLVLLRLGPVRFGLTAEILRPGDVRLCLLAMRARFSCQPPPLGLALRRPPPQGGSDQGDGDDSDDDDDYE